MVPTGSRVAIVTGASKGVGLALVRRLALYYPSSQLYQRSNQPLTIYLTARSSERGLQALESVLNDADPNLKDVLAEEGLVEVFFHKLDVMDKLSVQRLAEEVLQKHGGIDILVNNAGTLLTGRGELFCIAEVVPPTASEFELIAPC